MLRRFLANRGFISNSRVVFSNSCVEQYMYYVIMFRLRQWGRGSGGDKTQAKKMLALNCKRCMVRFYLILVRYWMGICGHTFTTSDQDSCVSINHTVPVFSPLWCMFATCFYSGVIPACLCFTYLVRELSCRWKYCLYIWIFSFVFFFLKIRLCSHRY